MKLNYENLTQLQKIAAKGELSMIFSFARTNADIKLHLYRIFRESDKKYKHLFFEATKEMLLLSEEEITKIFLLSLNNETPVFLWTDKIISNIEYYLNAPEMVYTSSKLAVNRKENRENILLSSFIIFAREALLISPNAVLKLLNAILSNDELSFLHTACIYLKESCEELKSFDCCEEDKSEDISEDILKCELDIHSILSLDIETKRLKQQDKPTKKPIEDNSFTISKGIIINKNDIADMTRNEFSQFLGEQFIELFGDFYPVEEENKEEHTTELCYVVQKKYKNTDIKEDIRSCKSEKEAVEFIKEIIKLYPDLQKTCEFIVCKKIIEI